MTVKEQLKGIRKGTEFEGWGAFAGQTVYLRERNLNGHAVFLPINGCMDALYLAHDNDTHVLRPIN